MSAIIEFAFTPKPAISNAARAFLRYAANEAHYEWQCPAFARATDGLPDAVLNHAMRKAKEAHDVGKLPRLTTEDAAEMSEAMRDRFENVSVTTKDVVRILSEIAS